MKKTIIIVGLAIALAAGGAYGYKQHQRAELIGVITPAVKNASIRATNASKLDTDKTNVTFGELFKRLDDDTAEIEKRSIEIQSVSTQDNSQITDPAIAYLKDCQEFERALAMKYRKALAYSNSMDNFGEALDEAKSATGYAFQYANRRVDKYLDEAGKNRKEAAEAKEALVAAAKKLKESRAKAAEVLPDDALIPVAQLDTVIKTNAAEAEQAGAKKG